MSSLTIDGTRYSFDTDQEAADYFEEVHKAMRRDRPQVVHFPNGMTGGFVGVVVTPNTKCEIFVQDESVFPKGAGGGANWNVY